MKLKAEIVIADCKRSLDILEEIDADEQLFRIQWLGCLALLSTIGDVLHKVDCNQHPKLKRLWNARFSELKLDKEKHSLFWNFIKSERNIIIHEYEFNFKANPLNIIYDDNAVAVLPDEFYIETDIRADIIKLPLDLYRPMKSAEKWGDIDCRDLIKEAINWWEQEINELKNKL